MTPTSALFDKKRWEPREIFPPTFPNEEKGYKNFTTSGLQESFIFFRCHQWSNYRNFKSISFLRCVKSLSRHVQSKWYASKSLTTSKHEQILLIKKPFNPYSILRHLVSYSKKIIISFEIPTPIKIYFLQMLYNRNFVTKN